MEILEKIFHWLYCAPLLYTPLDWAMCVGQIAIIKWCITIIRNGGTKNGNIKRYDKNKRIR